MTSVIPPGFAPPRVTIAIANYNGERFLEAAIRSALEQTIGELEVVVVDDCSQDNSVALARAIAAKDDRVVVDALAYNGGPAAARNRALDLARGEWFAILDNDDLMHPDRLARLIAAAERDGADIVADDLLLFADDNATPPRRLLDEQDEESRWIALPAYLDSGRMFGRGPSLGFLKPVIRRSAIERQGIRYDESLRIAEDDLFVIRMLTAGLRYRLVPTLGYFYRKHGSSISHRIAAHHLTAIADANARARGWLADGDVEATRAMDRRDASIARALAFTAAVSALKARRPLAAAAALGRRPDAVPLLRMLAEGAMAKRRVRGHARPFAAKGPVEAVILSRACLRTDRDGWSRLIGAARTLRSRSVVPHLLHFGGVGTIPEDAAVFATLNLRDGGAEWTDAERLFVAAKARPHGDLLLADSSVAAEGLVFALRPDAATTILADEPVRDANDAPAFVIEEVSAGAAMIGMRRLLERIWPKVLRRAPEARLAIVGSAGLSLDTLPAGVTWIRDARAVEQAYSTAAAALMPRTVGVAPSAALDAAFGRRLPVIGTRAALAGVAETFAQCVERHDDEVGFADAMLAAAGWQDVADGPLARWLDDVLSRR